jgi:hypothetical protein
MAGLILPLRSQDYVMLAHPPLLYGMDTIGHGHVRVVMGEQPTFAMLIGLLAKSVDQLMAERSTQLLLPIFVA